MMTILGKVFVCIIVCTSLIALGISVWLGIDRRDWKAERKAIGEEIYARQKALDFQRGALIGLLDEIRKGSRTMPWDPETNAVPKSVADTKKQNEDLAKENDKLFNDLNAQQVKMADIVTSLAQERAKYVTATAAQKRLRQEIKPDDPNQKGFRDLIGDHRKGKEDAEVAQEALRPDVMNELVRVAKVKARLDELVARLKELQVAGARSSARKP
jgi:hypothetical protein